MSLLLNRAKANTATTGTGTVNLGSGVAPYLPWASASPQSGAIYSYVIEDTGGAWEIGEGVYTAGSPDTLTRNLIASSSGSLLNLSGTATVACVMKALDVPQVIEKKTFAGGETSFTFSNIPQNFTSLQLEMFGRLQVASAAQAMNMTVNANGGAIYDIQTMSGLGTATPAASQTLTATSLNLGGLPGTSYLAGQATFIITDIVAYSQTSLWKPGRIEVRGANSTTTGDGNVNVKTCQFRTTAAISSIEILTIPGSGAMTAGSYAILRGIP